jgi:type IV pilus assembly protein PilY1
LVNFPVPDEGTKPFVRRLAKLKDASGRVQPITARPAGTHIGNIHIYYVGTGRYLGNSDLNDLGPGEISWQQTIYGIRDQLSKNDAPFTEDPGFTAPASFRDGTAALKVVQQTLTQSGANRTISKLPVDWANQDGFFIDLNPADDSPGERVFLDVRLVLGTLIVTSNIPNAGGGCVPGGQSYQYGLDYKTGGYVGNNAAAPAGQFINEFLVGAAIIQLADGSIKALNKTITGRNLTTGVSVENDFKGQRFSYRER